MIHSEDNRAIVTDEAGNVVAIFYGETKDADSALYSAALQAVPALAALAGAYEMRIETRPSTTVGSGTGDVRMTLSAWRDGRRYEAGTTGNLMQCLGELAPRVRRLVESGPVPMPAVNPEGVKA